MMWAIASSLEENSVAPLSLGYPVFGVDPSSRCATLLPLKTMALEGTAMYFTWLGKHSSKELLGCWGETQQSSSESEYGISMAKCLACDVQQNKMLPARAQQAIMRLCVWACFASGIPFSAS